MSSLPAPPPTPGTATPEIPSAPSFPRLSALTQRFTLGRPRSFQVTEDGARVLFLRSRGGLDAVTCLWALDVADGTERLVADPLALGDGESADLPAEERARRERAREQAGGITAFATDAAGWTVTFALGGRLGLADLRDGSATLLPAPGPVVDPRPSPDGRLVGYVTGGQLVVADRAGQVVRTERAPEGSTCGLAEFIAAEEFGRMRGFWWSPDSQAVLAAAVDEAAVQRWHVTDPIDPAAPASVLRYPAAGTPNAAVTLRIIPVLGDAYPVRGWDAGQLPYLVSASWSAAGLVLHVLSRDQRRSQVLLVDPESGSATVRAEQEDGAWVEVTPGLPRVLEDGSLLTALDDAASDTRRLALDGRPLSPPGVHVASVRHVGGGAALVVGTEGDPTVRHLYVVPLDGSAARRLTTDPGVHDAVAGGDVLVTVSATMDGPARAAVRRRGTTVAEIASHARQPDGSPPQVRILRGGPRDLRVGLVLPRGHVRGRPLPVLCDPYGGPHHAEVLAARSLWWEPQWLADQGFAVVVADGRGTPGRSVSWEKAICRDLATAPLQDQVDALALAAEHEPDLDLGRVAIRGWSFGGYLAALAVLRRPDVFHAAIAGAPVVDWRLYDTGYTERYLGPDPEGADAEAYRHSSLLADAPALARPLLLVHGMSDDNVVVAHTLRLSAALLAHGRPHDVLPVSGATHMAGAPEVAENLLRLQVGWLRRVLG